MIRDSSGPAYQLGFGLSDRDVPYDANSQSGPDPEGGFISKALHGHPVMRFFAVAAATLVGTAALSEGFKSTGKHVVQGLEKSGLPLLPASWQTQIAGDFRKTRQILDDLQGIVRNTVTDPITGRVVESHNIVNHFWWKNGDVAADWTVRQEIQQRLISQARRLPYELPAAYAAQRGIIDPILGNNQTDRGKWYNPVDLTTDFARQSLKNIAFMMAPFEAGGAAASTSLKKMLSYTGTATSAYEQTAVSMQQVLSRVGQDAGDLLYNTARIANTVSGGHQSTGVLSAAINSLKEKSPPLTELYKTARQRGLGSAVEDAKTGNWVTSFTTGLREQWHKNAESFNLLDQMYQGSLGADQLATARGAFGGSYSRVAARNLIDLGDSVDQSGGLVPGLFRAGQQKNAYYQTLQGVMQPYVENPQDLTDILDQLHIQVPRGMDPDRWTRINFGDPNNKILTKSKQEFWDSVLTRAQATMPKNPQVNRLIGSGAMDQAIRVADQQYLERLTPLNRKISSVWSEAHDNVTANFLTNKLGQVPRSFQQFANVDVGAQDWLVTEVARTLNINTQQSIGSLKTDIARLGVNPNDPYQMQMHLVRKGVVAKPWTQNGFGFTGIKPLSIDRGIRMGYYDKAEADELKSLSKLGGDRLLNAKVAPRGVYETRGGKIIDLTPTFSAARRFLNTAADQTQIPIIGFNPLNLFGYGARRTIADKNIVEYIAGRRPQPFVGSDQSVEAYIAIRNRGLKSKVFGITNTPIDTTAGYSIGNKSIAGEFYVSPTSDSSLLGRHTRFAISDAGRAAQQSTFAKAFSINPDQPDSRIGYLKRVLNKREDMNNPAIAARAIAGKVAAGEALTQADYEAYQNLVNYTQRYPFKAHVLRQLQRNPVLEQMLSDPETGRAITDFKSPGELIDFAKRIKLHDASRLSPDIQRTYDMAYENYLGRNLSHASDPDFFHQATSRSMRKVGLYTRLEQFQNDFVKFMTLRQGMGVASGVQSFDNTVSEIMGELHGAVARGSITNTDFTEAQAALLATQFNFNRILSSSGRTAVRTPAGAVEEAIRKSLGPGSIFFRDFNGTSLYDTLTGEHIGGRDTPLGFINKGRASLRSRFRPAEYRFAADKYNPLSYGQDSVFIPTTKTAMARGRVRALSSVFGFNTWSNPEFFSAGSIPIAHGVQRLNKFFESVGLGLQEQDFSGPLSFYAKGIVGKRLLPIVATGTAAITLDRTLGGFTTPKDNQGNRVYRPIFLGGAARGLVDVQAAAETIMPSKGSYSQNRDQLLRGEVPVRQGRYWLFGSNPFLGGRIQYYHPSWYQRLDSGYQYTPETSGSPAKKLLFDYDFSPLRPFDPYRMERKHYGDRPYPTSGEYFTGPWGPLTGALNMTLGKVLKPQIRMHKQELADALNTYNVAGEYGVSPPVDNAPRTAALISRAEIGPYPSQMSAIPLAPRSGGTSTGIVRGMQNSYNQALVANTAKHVTGSKSGQRSIYAYNQGVLADASPTNRNTHPVSYNVVTSPGAMSPRVIPGGVPINPKSFGYQAGQFGFEAQETLGIYGFTFDALRQRVGMGRHDLVPRRPVLASASAAYGTGRSWENLNIGGIGDVRTISDSPYANLEVSELIRRFVVGSRRTNTINPIPNTLGLKYPFLPGGDNVIDYTRGDPMGSIPEGEFRLPGTGYQRFNKLHSDQYGRYGLLDQYKILADIAPYSPEFRQLSAKVKSMTWSGKDADLVQTVQDQLAARAQKTFFAPYRYKGTDYKSTSVRIKNQLSDSVYQTNIGPVRIPGVHKVGQSVPIYYNKNASLPRTEPIINAQVGQAPSDITTTLGSIKERLLHRDNYINTKFLRQYDATEDWERFNVYGQTFPQWQHPLQDYIKPVINRSIIGNPIVAGLGLAGIGSLFSPTPKGKLVGAAIGGLIGATGSLFIHAKQALTGEHFVPKQRRKELATEENIDILSYVRDIRNANAARMQGDQVTSDYFTAQSQKTMYGADLNAPPEQLAAALPKRKRDYFEALINAPVNERQRILAVSGRLERRIYESAWGMKVEQRPDLTDYFSKHELPDSDWRGWQPDVNMNDVQIKVAQSQGLDSAQMGFYPDQIQQANAINIPYPDFTKSTSKHSVEAQLRSLLYEQGINGTIIPVNTPYSGTRVNLHQGLF